MPVLAEARDRSRHVRGDDVRAAARQRALYGERGQAGRKRHLHARSELLGPRSADQSRLLEFRHHPLRLLPRRQHPFRGLQERPLRRAQRKPIPAAGRPLTIFRRCATAAWSRRNSPTACPRAWTASCSTRAGRSLPTCACARRSCNLFDFEWINHTYFFDLYKRTASYFDGCDLSAHGVPADARERALLGAVSRRRARRHHGRHLGAAGHRRLGPRPRRTAQGVRAVRRSRLRAQRHATGAHSERPAVRLRDPHHHPRPGARWRSPSCAASSAPASTRSVRSVDATQFERRRIGFDFDMMQYRWEQSLSPGNEQMFYWGSAAAGEEGSRNYMGVKSKAVDAMIAAMLVSHDARGFRRRDPRARPRAAVGLLRGAALLSAQTMDSALDANQASLADLVVRLSAGNVVAWGRQMILSGHAKDRRQPRHARRPVPPRRRAPRRRAGTRRSAQLRGADRQPAAPADLCRRPTAPCRRSPPGCARSGCKPTPWWPFNSPTPWTASSPCSACCAPA